VTSRTFVKSAPTAPDGYPAEAAGLAWLAAAGGARIARVVDVSSDRIVIERIDEVRADAAAAEAFGSALAVTHRAGAAGFGSAPDGWNGRLFIGRRDMPAAREATWGRFYARDRVLPFLAAAERVGSVTNREAAVVRSACALIAEGFFDDGEPPARIHGDLWSGNVLWGRTGVVLIDPAAHGGHRETDLAMLHLFGCAFLDDVIAGYDAAWPLAHGWAGRLPLHHLHPLAVHAAGHGRRYGVALAHAAREVLALAE
jgi:fructosamine-3-kinase